MFASASYTTVALRVVHTQTYHPGTGSPAKVFGRGARGGRTVFQKGFPPRKLFHQNKKSPAGTGDDQNHMQGEKSFVARRGAPQGKSIKKDPSRCELQGGLRTIFGSGLLSHMTLCSIIGDGELNFRVRNGVGCTLSSMATKEIW